MRRVLTVLCMTALAGTVLAAQAPSRPSSPRGTAEIEVAGKWETVKGQNGRERQVFQGGKWVTLEYGRPLKRGRELFGTGDAYATRLNAGAPVWRAGADPSTLLKTEAPLVIGGKTLPPGDYVLFIELKPAAWTLIVSSHKRQEKYDPNNKAEIWGAYGYDASKDVVRVPMTVNTIPFSVEQLTWGFTDVTDKGFVLQIWWDKANALVPVTLGSS
jgi:hypothetical protein